MSCRAADDRSKLAIEGAVEDGGEEGVEFGGGFGLEPLHLVHLRLQAVEIGDDALRAKRRIRGLWTATFMCDASTKKIGNEHVCV
jgi:hypothetical protein